MAAAMWGGAARRIAIGYSFVTVLLGVLPYGMFHEGVVMPWWVRALILANVLTIGLGYGLGSHPRTGQPRTFVLGGIADLRVPATVAHRITGFSRHGRGGAA